MGKGRPHHAALCCLGNAHHTPKQKPEGMPLSTCSQASGCRALTRCAECTSWVLGLWVCMGLFLTHAHTWPTPAGYTNHSDSLTAQPPPFAYIFNNDRF